MPVLSLRGCKARRNREHVETFSSALLWSGSIRMTLYYMPGWIMEALVGEHFNWCMNMQLCLIPGPEINHVDVRGLFLAFTTCTLILWLFVMLGWLYSVFAAVEKKEESGPCSSMVYLHLESTTRKTLSFCKSLTQRVKMQVFAFSDVFRDKGSFKIRTTPFFFF